MGTKAAGAVSVEGLDELRFALRALDPAADKRLRVALRKIAGKVVQVAKGKMEFGPGEAMSSLGTTSTRKGSGITFPTGGTPWRGVKADYYPWLDFGGTIGKGHDGQAVKNRMKGGAAMGDMRGAGSTSRRFIKGGRYIYPAIADSTEYIEENAARAIWDAAHAVQLATSGGGW